MYAKALFAAALLAVTASANAVPNNHGQHATRYCEPYSKSYCCAQTVAPDAAGVGVLASLVNNLFVGVQCVPINVNVLALDETAQCSTALTGTGSGSHSTSTSTSTSTGDDHARKGQAMCCSGRDVDDSKLVFGCAPPSTVITRGNEDTSTEL
ncbi:hypothetical protein CXG81DRAFT_28932 [Caulochytrium protostelioides]|uniref:Hydrophobin n=1 Tax=Caulochytrium protostelioides TaxID=1555241 RepID=A0A4P9X184_9FUNG|nr:hypothetical protein CAUPRSCDRAFT_10798 [Caulochytrium protostelioides]RKO98243.1 hypothetical protein CXG81DRAFT_28932 [Caulochytrium protostelioides]|eukprot:RKO98243.1 hypothetical protein CXG81DRAFT_28932 [Caulochytrium protostelioides]